MSYLRVNEKCNGCLACLQNCPATAIDVIDKDEKRTLLHNMARCARCGTCWRVCPQDAIEFQHILENQWDEVVSLDLAHCTVCGEILYTLPFGDTLAEKIGEQGTPPLCARHRDALERKVNTLFSGAKQQQKR